jgi:nucleoside-diphosphate-sugar epimerase
MPPRTRAAAPTSFPPVPANCVVTGGSGFVGQRLVEMLVERGATRVVSFDIAPKPRDALEDARIVYQQGDLTKLEDVLTACQARGWRARGVRVRPFVVCATRRRSRGRCAQGADCVWHIAALVGPYYEHKAYYNVNYLCAPAPLRQHSMNI